MKKIISTLILSTVAVLAVDKDIISCFYDEECKNLKDRKMIEKTHEAFACAIFNRQTPQCSEVKQIIPWVEENLPKEFEECLRALQTHHIFSEKEMTKEQREACEKVFSGGDNGDR